MIITTIDFQCLAPHAASLMSHPDAPEHIPAPQPSHAVTDRIAQDLQDLFVRGTPANTLRAYEQDLAYIAAWKKTAFGTALSWPESEETALRFVLDHALDLTGAAPETPARQTAEALIAAGLRRGLKAPAPSTLDRRIAS